MLLAVPALLLLALVANVVPLAQLVPKTIRVTGPVQADWRALFWIGFCLLTGLVASTQGVHQIRHGTRSWRVFAVTLACGALVLGAGLLGHALR